MSYFLLMGSPGRRQVLGPHRPDHHAGWLDVDSFSWLTQGGLKGGGPGKAGKAQLEVSRASDLASTRLLLHCHAGEGFDLVVLDAWDDAAGRSKVRFEFREVIIASCRHDSGVATFTLDFAEIKQIPKPQPLDPVTFKLALTGAAT